MKKLRIVLLPAALILIGAAAAFATNAVKSSDDPVDGYYFDTSSGECISPMQCSNIEGNTCTWEDHNLCRLNGTQCSVKLSKLPQ
jgi:hypothetical protein